MAVARPPYAAKVNNKYQSVEDMALKSIAHGWGIPVVGDF